ncbi:MAG: ATP-dependent Clp protease proteolytic subunit, partial [Candidatus Eremiobacteraeota bacterium]|nr:ATP-dependent Clp protease proteolytic subunit [Candidatus Eremiobacteraeota bacterium]
MKLLALRGCVSALLLLGAVPALVRAAPGAPVVLVPIQGTVDSGMAHLVERSVRDAQADRARAIALDVNSPGGLVDAAFEIRDALFSAHVPVIAYVGARAYSAAALIALSADRIVVGPGSSIGAAEPIPATEKMISALRGEFQSTAERNHRNAAVAGAMVDKYVDLPQYKRSGAILTLDTSDALRSGVAQARANSFDDALADAGLSGAPRITESLTWGERVARFATDPRVSGLLLTLGLLGLLIEMQTLHGIAGAIGIGALALFFGSHVYAGFSNGFVAALAFVGLIGILWELHVVPGHGIPGILGGIALLVAVLLAFGLPFFFVGIETVATAIVLTVIGFTLALRAVPE